MAIVKKVLSLFNESDMKVKEKKNFKNYVCNVEFKRRDSRGNGSFH